MPTPCTGGFQFGNRYFQLLEPKGHGNLTLAQAIEKSCDVYFYQLGLKVGLRGWWPAASSSAFATGRASTCPKSRAAASRTPTSTSTTTRSTASAAGVRPCVLNLAIGQGENAQTVVNMARFYTALATDGTAAKPEIARHTPRAHAAVPAHADQLAGLRAALAGVVSSGGTAAARAIQGVRARGKDGHARRTAQDRTQRLTRGSSASRRRTIRRSSSR